MHVSQQIITLARLVILTLVPYVLAAQGTMLGGRAGVFSVAQEGIMLVSAVVGFLGAYYTGSLFYGALLAMLAGGLVGLAFAYFTTTLKMDQFVIGLALFFATAGLSTLIYKIAIGVTLKPPLIPTLQDIPIPLLERIPFLGDILFRQNVFVYFTIFLSVGLWYLLYRTGLGLEIRSVGENPLAADSLGVNVTLVRYATTIVGGMLMGLAGAYLPMAYTGTFTEDIVRGRGWLSIALTYFGGWAPHTIFLAALFFAGVEVFAFRAQVTGIGIPYQFLLMLPYIATILVMIPGFRWAREPAFLGKNYDREKRGIS
ncbi:MAG: ABC transporter permease [Chloroflexi bacterium]|nr:ABC transporter permease [Chloroflexota bacterium]